MIIGGIAMHKMPALFIGHGSPLNIIAHNDFTASLAQVARQLPRPEAILVVSAHWLTEGTYVSATPQPETIYDFYGFPRELYQISYSCPGSPTLARAAANLTPAIQLDDQRGLDHAAWAVLHHMYPAADLPVFSLSLDYHLPPADHYRLATTLQPLREQGVLIIGSGNIVHNLHLIDYETDAPVFDWANRFDNTVRDLLLIGDDAALIDYHSLGPDARLSIPTNDHYLPMLYTLGLRNKDDQLTFIHESMQNASISMRSFMLAN